MFGLLTILAYLAAAGFLAAGIGTNRKRLNLLGAICAWLAVIAHGAWLAAVMPVSGGFDFNFFNSLSLVSWLAVIFLLLAAMRWELLEVGIIAFPGSALWVSLQLAFEPAPVVLSHAPPLSEAHIVSSLLAYAILSIAALTAVAVAAQDYILRHPRAGRLLALLPPLTTMEHVLFQLILAGWVVLTLSLATGMMFVDENLFARHLAHKTILTIASWIIFGLLLLGRWRFGWRGRTAVTMTLSGMAILLLGYFGAKLVLELILDRTWLQSAGIGLSSIPVIHHAR